VDFVQPLKNKLSQKELKTKGENLKRGGGDKCRELGHG